MTEEKAYEYVEKMEALCNLVLGEGVLFSSGTEIVLAKHVRELHKIFAQFPTSLADMLVTEY